MKNSRKEQTQSIGSRVAVGAILIYQRLWSPDTGAFRAYVRILTSAAPNAGCRFFPSCSEYALEAIRQYGLFRGGVISLRRVVSCSPFSRGGHDPVPAPPRTRA